MKKVLGSKFIENLVPLFSLYITFEYYIELYNT